MYDYNNGRFLSVDPFIQDPTNTQSLNPYTYILNNPLSGVDPTGYIIVPIGKYILKKLLKKSAKKQTKKDVKKLSKKQKARVKQKASKIQRENRKEASKQKEFKKAESNNGNTNKEVSSKLKNEKQPSSINKVDRDNKMINLFNKPKHKLDKIVELFKSPEKAFNAIQKATSAAVKSQGKKGKFVVDVKIGSQTITVKGNVVDGVARIGTAFIK